MMQTAPDASGESALASTFRSQILQATGQSLEKKMLSVILILVVVIVVIIIVLVLFLSLSLPLSLSLSLFLSIFLSLSFVLLSYLISRRHFVSSPFACQGCTAMMMPLSDNTTTTWYSYENLTLRQKNVLHVRSADGSGNGQIKWQTKSSTTPWQGFFRLLDDDTVEYEFDAYARRVMKSGTLFKVAEGLWEGLDYQCRLVRLTKMRTMQYCTARQTWRPVPGEQFVVLALPDQIA